MEGKFKRIISCKLESYLIPIILAMLGFAFDIFYQLKHGIAVLNSDISAEMVLADILNKSHEIIAQDWFYSTEIRVFATQWVYRVGLLLFPDNWYYARTLSVAICMIALYISIVLMAKACDLTYYGLWVAAFSMWPYSYWQRYLVTYGLVYVPYTIFTCLSIFCIVKLFLSDFKNQRRYVVIYTILLAFFAFASGLNGIRQLMSCFAPVALAGFIMLFIKDDDGKIFSKNGIRMFIISIFAFVINLLGYLVNMLYFPKVYTFYEQSDHAWGDGTNSWIMSIRWFFEQFGYCQDWKMGMENIQEVKLFSFNGIAVLLGLALGFAIIISLIYLIKKAKALSYIDLYLLILIISMIFVIGFATTYFFAVTSQYWTQTLPFGFLLLVLAIKNLPTENCAIPDGIIKHLWKYKSVVTLSIVSIILIISSRAVTKSYGEYHNGYAKYGLADVVDWIEENTDYDTGVSVFWTSDIVTELSDGRIEMYTVVDACNPTTIREWLQKKSHNMESLSSLEHYFVLYEDFDAHGNSDIGVKKIPGAKEIYNDGIYVVYGVN